MVLPSRDEKPNSIALDLFLELTQNYMSDVGILAGVEKKEENFLVLGH